MTFIIIDLIFCAVFIIAVSQLYKKEYEEVIAGSMNLSLLSMYTTFYPVFNVGDKFLNLKMNILSFGLIALLFKILCIFFNFLVLKCILLVFLLAMVFLYNGLYKQRKSIIQMDMQEGHECECALPVLKATKYVLIFKVITYIGFLFL